MMGLKPVIIINSALCVTLILLTCSPPGVCGSITVCYPSSLFGKTTQCPDGYHCCGPDNNDCCEDIIPYRPQQEQAMEAVAMFIVFIAVTCCCVCCYRCCCRRTTSRGFVYSTPGATTAVSVTLPPQQSQQVPYPTVVPYPQQTPYPPQYNPPQYNPPTNPYYGMPPPAYGVAVQSGNQQASAPSAPYIG